MRTLIENGHIKDSGWKDRLSTFLERKRISTAAEVLYSYVGVIDQEKVHQIVAEVENILLDSEMPKGKVKKTFNILLEGLQNMAIHSADIQGDHIVGLSVSELDGDILIRIIGLTRPQTLLKVKEAVAKLNAMERTELKAHYLDVMENGELSAKGGAGLGLITMVLKSADGMVIESQVEKDDLCILSQSLRV